MWNLGHWTWRFTKIWKNWGWSDECRGVADQDIQRGILCVAVVLELSRLRMVWVRGESENKTRRIRFWLVEMWMLKGWAKRQEIGLVVMIWQMRMLRGWRIMAGEMRLLKKTNSRYKFCSYSSSSNSSSSSSRGYYFWLSPSTESCNWIDLWHSVALWHSVSYASWYHWNWSNTAQGCNHQSIWLQLQPLCSAALVGA